MDKTQRYAKRVEDDSVLESLSNIIGTQFNLRLARVLRSKVVLFVEGRDMVILRKMASTLGLVNIEKELHVTIIPLEGYSNKDLVTPFAWLTQHMLSNTIKVFVILDSDYRPAELAESIEKEFSTIGINAHVWRRKELESYLITPSVIARLAGLPEPTIEKMLYQVTDELRMEVLSQSVSEQQHRERSLRIDPATIIKEINKQLDDSWDELSYRLGVVPPKSLISKMNQRLSLLGNPTINSRKLANEHYMMEIPNEMSTILTEINRACL
jgi:hypothetical protein